MSLHERERRFCVLSLCPYISALLWGRACAQRCWSCINHTSAWPGSGDFLACAAREVVTWLCRRCWQEVLPLCRRNVPSLPTPEEGWSERWDFQSSSGHDQFGILKCVASRFQLHCRPKQFGFFRVAFWLGFVMAFFWSPVQRGSSEGY